MITPNPKFPNYDARIAAAREELVRLEQTFEDNKKKEQAEDRMWGGVRIMSSIRRINKRIKILENERDNQDCLVAAINQMLENFFVDKLKGSGYGSDSEEHF